MLRNRHHTLFLTSALLLLVLAGCSTAKASASTSTGEPAIGAVPKILDSSTLRLPVEDYLPSSAEDDRLGVADLALIRSCMARFGIKYDIKPILGSTYGPVSLTDRRYGITDATLAAHYGYGLGPRDPALQKRPDKPDIGSAGETALSGEGQSEVNGITVPNGGCIGEADRKLSGSVPASVDMHKGNTLQFQSFAQSRADSRVVAAFKEWSACMARSGYHYADPLAAAGDPDFAGAANSHDVAVALADISCKSETNLVGIWFTVESAYERQVIDADPVGFAATKQAITARDQAAVALSASAAPTPATS